jgi:hypothetical protein
VFAGLYKASITENNEGSKTEEMPEVSAMMEGRDNVEAYAYYSYHFLPYILGKRRWRLVFNKRLTMDDMATASDEAFGLLVLENNYKKWTWMVNKNKEEQKAKANEMPKTPYYTVGRGSRTEKYQGWTLAGMEKFGELGREITATHNSDETSDWDTKFYKECEEKYLRGAPQIPTPAAGDTATMHGTGSEPWMDL